MCTRVRGAVLLFALAILIGGCSHAPTPAAVAPSPALPVNRWTLMLYCDCDNDLEESTLKNLQDICRVGSSSEIAMVALVDRARKGQSVEGYSNAPLNNLPDWSNAKLLKIEHDRFEELDDWGELNMANGQVLSRFLQEAIKRYPAQHYGLVILDHGDAWAGVCVDDTAPEPDDMLRPAELQTALHEAGFHGKKKLDLMVFDACLMANLELLSALSEEVRLVVASEEIIPDAGLHYSTCLAQLKNGLWKTGDEPLLFGRELVASNHPQHNPDLTHLALLRLDRLQQVESKVEQLAQSLLKRLQQSPRPTWLKLARCRSLSQDFGRSDLPLVPNAEVRDVVDLSQHVAKSFPDLAPLCRQIAQAVDAVRVSQVRTRSLSHAHGLTVFFPPQTESTQELASTDYFELVPAQLSHWSAMIKAYTEFERNDSSRPVLEPVKSSGEEWQVGEIVELQSRLSKPQELSSCEFLISQKDIVIGSLPSWPEADSTLVHDQFDGTSLVLTSPPGGRIFCPIKSLIDVPQMGGGEHPSLRRQSQDQVLTMIAAQYKKEGAQKWIDISLIFGFDLTADSLGGKLSKAVRNTSRGSTSVSLRKGDSLRLVREGVRSGVGPQPSEPITINDPQQLAIRPWGLPAGDYLMGYRIHDYSGHSALETTPVKVIR